MWLYLAINSGNVRIAALWVLAAQVGGRSRFARTRGMGDNVIGGLLGGCFGRRRGREVPEWVAEMTCHFWRREDDFVHVLCCAAVVVVVVARCGEYLLWL